MVTVAVSSPPLVMVRSRSPLRALCAGGHLGAGAGLPVEGAQEAVRAVHGQVVHAARSTRVFQVSAMRLAGLGRVRPGAVGAVAGGDQELRAGRRPGPLKVRRELAGRRPPRRPRSVRTAAAGSAQRRAPGPGSGADRGRRRPVVGVPVVVRRLVARRCRAARPGSVSSRPKSKAEVRSPQTARRHGEMFGSCTPNRRSMNRMIEVWSKTSEQT